MMRRADAEAILGKKINGYFSSLFRKILNFYKNNWARDYVTVFEVPELAERVIPDISLIAVHPGFCLRYGHKDAETEKYKTYLKNLKKRMNEEVLKGKTVLIMCSEHPITYETKMKEIFGDLKNVIWALGQSFYEEISPHIGKVYLVGELRKNCLANHASSLDEYNIKYERLEDCVFP